MDQLDLLRRLAATLERLQIRYAIVGSFASGAWGEPRLTNDIDVVVEIDVVDAQAICQAFPSPEFYVSNSAAEEAVASRGQFNIIHPGSGGKVDLMVVGGSPWSQSQLDRAIAAPLLPGESVRVAAPEDVILGKLLYYQDGGSEKHVRDITGILVAGFSEVDTEYVLSHAIQLGVAEEWRSIVDSVSDS